MLVMPLKLSPLIFLATIVSAFWLPASAEEEVLDIFAPWEAEGKLYRVGPDETQFVGAFDGVMYVQAGTGELEAAIFVCPTVHVLNEKTNEATASGSCHIVAAEGNVFGRFSCKGGENSCDGQFEVTAGTDAFEGISGNGPILIRTALSATMRDATSGEAISEAAGLAIWRGLRVDIPEAARNGDSDENGTQK